MATALDSDEAFTEEHLYRPRTLYNASKAAPTTRCAYFETYVFVTITNCSNNYGLYQFPEKVILLFVTHALDELQLPLYASMQNRREWLHVVDHYCRADWSWCSERTRGRDIQRRPGLEVSVEELADRSSNSPARAAS